MDADMVFARYLQEEEAAFASQIANDRNCARLLEEEEHVNDGVLPSDAERVLYKRMDDRTRATIACGDDEEAEWQLKQQRLRGIQAQRNTLPTRVLCWSRYAWKCVLNVA